MPSINVLSKEISELIAAGEVIERPSSVIKELVENSIDSGARHVTVEIKNGGLTYMRVTDDGCGMAFDDVPTAFLRHATSKITTKADLDNINTLGFRGEALASVAAVSRVEVMTKPAAETYGTLYTIEGSVEKSHEKGGCPDGTTIMIRDLFYNVPARAKFMKKDVTEANHVSSIMQKIALSHPDVAFKLIRDNRMEFNSAGDGELFSAVYAVYGRDFARDLVPTDYEYEGIRVSGYVIKPLYSRNNRTFQNFFVNGRYVKSRLCSSAVENAYSNMIMTGKFPACVLMIEMSPSAMDVNIHPAKAEVRFTDEKTVANAIFFSVKDGLVNSGLVYEFEIKPKVDWTKPEPEKDTSQQLMFTPVDQIEKREEQLKKAITVLERPEPRKQVDYTVLATEPEDEEFDEPDIKQPEPPTAHENPPEPDQTAELPEDAPAEEISGFRYINSGSFHEASAPETAPPEAQTETAEEERPEIKVVGEAFGLYVIVEYGGDMVMIDKHAAHERIIFERLKSRSCRQYSQTLLTGIKVLLTSEEIDALENNTELLADLGFTFDFSERPCITATAVPTFIMDADMENVICEVADNLRRHKQNPQSGLLDDMLHTMACKAAVKANDRNTPEEMKSLAEQVIFNESIRHCPHGRPVMFTMTKGNIDHQFKRT